MWRTHTVHVRREQTNTTFRSFACDWDFRTSVWAGGRLTFFESVSVEPIAFALGWDLRQHDRCLGVPVCTQIIHKRDGLDCYCGRVHVGQAVQYNHRRGQSHQILCHPNVLVPVARKAKVQHFPGETSAQNCVVEVAGA